jgi:hypothetical protein
MTKSIVGIVDTQQQAEQVVSDLQRVGFDPPDVAIVSPTLEGSQDFAFERRTKAPESALTGVLVGAFLAGIVGLLAGMGALAIPGLGPLMAAGPLLAALSGAAIGALIGGILGAIVGMAIPELVARRYETRPSRGNILVAVHVNSRDAARDAVAVLRRDGAHDVVSTRDARAAA